jgi:polyphosphate kinase 2 (PPK2 family)
MTHPYIPPTYRSHDEEIKVADFIVSGRPRLSAIKDFPAVEFANYEKRLTDLQRTMQVVQQAYLGTPHRAVIILEGWDTAGKGGVVRRLGWTLDPRSFKVHAIAAPSDREKSLHYLQRFWERLPEHGQIVVFDRSWYGRVLVERVEALASEPEWRRAYHEINEFERMLLADGTRVVKLFLHITSDEQVHRFRARLTDPLKRWKLSYEDFRNHKRWRSYETAIEDMFEKTSTSRAPWYLVPANNKPFSRLAAIRIITDRLARDVSLEPRPIGRQVALEAERLLGITVAPDSN